MAKYHYNTLRIYSQQQSNKFAVIFIYTAEAPWVNSNDAETPKLRLSPGSSSDENFIRNTPSYTPCIKPYYPIYNVLGGQ